MAIAPRRTFRTVWKVGIVPLFLLSGREAEGKSSTVLTKKEQQLLDALEPLAADRGVEVVTVEVIGSSKAPVIRVYIDAEDGVSFKELTESQEWIGETMDEIDPFPGAYTLEVSSPGIDRPLRTAAHFARFVGEEAKIRTMGPIDGQANFKGVIAEVEGDEVAVEFDGRRACIPISSIRRANLVGRVDF